MRFLFEDIHVSTKNRTELIDVTSQVEEIVRKSGVTNGLCAIHSVHSTTAVIVNENESGLTKDIIKKVQQDFPRAAGWLHNMVDDNADAHLAASFIGSTKILAVRDGQLIRGTWQNVFLLELDGPRSRRIVIEVMGE